MAKKKVGPPSIDWDAVTPAMWLRTNWEIGLSLGSSANRVREIRKKKGIAPSERESKKWTAMAFSSKFEKRNNGHA